MKIFTKTKRINKSREAVLEFILNNHPLDCPICDEAGECDLQEILLNFGSDRGRFYELNKRAVNNLNCAGPFIKTVMTRCIQCTRCVRFAHEISALYDFGVIGRGLKMEIGTYILNFLNDELLGNIIDLCPVGALISMPASFSARSWEIKYTQSIDILDSIATSIRVGISVNSVKRILPNLEEYYDEWLSNKARFVYDSFNIQRLHYPKLKLFYKFISISWKIALYLFLYLLYNTNYIIQSFIGPYSSLELVYNLKSFFNSIGCNNIYYYEVERNIPDFNYSFLLNNTLKNLNNINDLLIIGANIRLESPLLNSVYRKNYLNNLNFKVYIIGLGLNYLNYKTINIGSNLVSFNKYILGLLIVNKYFLFNDYYNLSFFNKTNLLSKNILLGSSSLIRNDSSTIINTIWNFIKLSYVPIKHINILSRNLGRISAYEFNVLYNIKSMSNIAKNNKKNYFNFFIGVDNLCNNKKSYNHINIFLGSFFIINFFEFINLIFSSSIYVEDIFSYLNLEGRYRYTNKVITPAKYVYSDYKIINSLNILLKKIYIWNFSVINNYNNILLYFIKNYNFFNNYNVKYKNIVKYYLNNIYTNIININIINTNIYNMKNINTIFSKVIYNYYNTDIYSKLSPSVSLMALKINYKIFN
jgi:NADH dehydrogenase/NADH:ubiquinone oxidoreductase subunit G